MPHRSVLLDEAVDGLDIEPAGVYFDGTYGRGGHSAAILSRLNSGGRLVATDKDPEAIADAGKFGEDQRFQILQQSFAELVQAKEKAGVDGFDGILLDLGVSSPQLDNAERGFSFMKDGPLDLRMNPDEGRSAAEWLATADVKEIGRVLRDYGEEKQYRRISRAIVARRAETPVSRTLELAKLIADITPRKEMLKKNPATRTFQALRIFINNELGDLERCLAQVDEVLKPGGRLVVISFHSLEDRMVKRFLKAKAQPPLDPRSPVPLPSEEPTYKLVGKAMKPSDWEVDENPRARSAVLRIGEKL